MPAGLTYENTITTIPNWEPTIHRDCPRGYAYEAETHFVHFYGSDAGLWVISSGLTATEAKEGTLADWVARVFGARDVQPLANAPGTVADAVWRPGLYYEEQIFQALTTNRIDRRAAEQSLFLLVEKLSEILLFVEPEGVGLEAYGPKTRELLILAATEVENVWAQYMRFADVASTGQGYTTRDYVRLTDPLHLAEYRVRLAAHKSVPPIYPFRGWSAKAPTQSLLWYDAYNKTKHDRTANLAQATVMRCIEAVAANVVLFCVRFGPYSLYQAATRLSSHINPLLEVG